MKVRVQPINGAEPFECVHNVAKRIKALGGKAVYGWRVVDDKEQNPVAIMRQHHVIWESPEGELQDVTPEPLGAAGGSLVYGWHSESIEFERDDSVPMIDKALPTKYCPRQPKWAKVCEWMTIADVALKDGDLRRCKYWTDKANAVVEKQGLPGWDTPTSMEWEDLMPTMIRPFGGFRAA